MCSDCSWNTMSDALDSPKAPTPHELSARSNFSRWSISAHRKSKRTTSARCRSTASASWTTTASASPTSASSRRACSVAAETTPRWACSSAASGLKTSSSTAASESSLSPVNQLLQSIAEAALCKCFFFALAGTRSTPSLHRAPGGRRSVTTTRSPGWCHGPRTSRAPSSTSC